MSIEFLPPELLCMILEKCSHEEAMVCTLVSRQMKDCAERDLVVEFDGTGSSIKNIFHRYDRIKKVCLEQRHYDLFRELFDELDFELSIY